MINGLLKKENVDLYRARIRYRKKVVSRAKRVTSVELKRAMGKFVGSPNFNNYVEVLKEGIGSSTWLGNSYLRYLVSYINFVPEEYGEKSDRNQYILNQIVNKRKIKGGIGKKEVFGAIYQDLLYSHSNDDYSSILKCPPIDCTLVLVSGIFNELFSTAAFERGAQYLNDHYGVEYFCPEVSGTKSVKHNAKMLEEQLLEYIEKNPEKKLWLFAYSKGGIDSLHFFKNHKEFIERHVVGLSTVASPILGTNRLDHTIFKIANNIHVLSKTKIYKFIDDKFDILAKDLQRFLTVKYQKPWFKKNNTKLPRGIFYSALALETEWYEKNVFTAFSKLFWRSGKQNDGIIDVENALYPSYFSATNLGIIKGHHWISAFSSSYCQEALLEAHIIFFKHYKML